MNKIISLVIITILLVLFASLRYGSDDDIPRPKSQESSLEFRIH